MIYLTIGFAWAIWSLYYTNKQQTKAKEYWFVILLFGTLLWPFLMYFSYERGILPKVLTKVMNYIKMVGYRLYR